LNILIAPDKFKGSLNSFEVCDAIERGLRSGGVGPDEGSPEEFFRIVKMPLADGGDGLLEVIRHYTDARPRYAQVHDPLSRTIYSSWLLSGDGRTAFIEMAKASGLQLLEPPEYNCLLATTFGTGQLIGEAIRSGVEEIVIGIGGSATNDGGIGMAAALGIRFLDATGKELAPNGGNLERIVRIDLHKSRPWKGIRFRVASDVQNPLCGPEGASRIYAPQKGAGPEEVDRLEAGMLNYAAVLKRDLGIDLAGRPGAGAAGGLGAGCMAFLDAALVGGAELVFEYSGAEERVQEADMIITGEGKIDEQTLQGKLVAGIAALGKRYHKPVIAFCGQLAISVDNLRQLGIGAVYPILDGIITLEEAMRDAAALLEDKAWQVGKLLRERGQWARDSGR
jgi:glycerate kinase